jgi:hypothetical protein
MFIQLECEKNYCHLALFMVRPGNTSLLLAGSITLPPASFQTCLELTVVDVNQYFCISKLGQRIRRLTVRDMYHYELVSIPWYVRSNLCDGKNKNKKYFNI